MLHAIQERLRREPMTRIVAFGSSNTERAGHSEGRYNWVDWVDVGLRLHFGRVHHTLNAGVSGQTCVDCLERFDRDVAFYRPAVVFITLGGNDCNPTRDVPLERFRETMHSLVARTQAIGDCQPVLQTYYAADIDRLPPPPDCALHFHTYMQAVREIARESGAYLIDHLARWERLRHADVDTYRTLMRDPMHLKPLGNMLLGLDVLRHFGVTALQDIQPYIETGLELQRLLDALEADAPGDTG